MKSEVSLPLGGDGIRPTWSRTVDHLTSADRLPPREGSRGLLPELPTQVENAFIFHLSAHQLRTDYISLAFLAIVCILNMQIGP